MYTHFRLAYAWFRIVVPVVYYLFYAPVDGSIVGWMDGRRVQQDLNRGIIGLLDTNSQLNSLYASYLKRNDFKLFTSRRSERPSERDLVLSAIRHKNFRHLAAKPPVILRTKQRGRLQIIIINYNLEPFVCQHTVTFTHQFSLPKTDSCPVSPWTRRRSDRFLRCHRNT